MSNNRIRAGKAIAARLKAKDPDYYKKLGAMGGAALTGKKGFALSGLAREAGRKGGLVTGDKYKTQAFVPDNTEFGEGFDQPS